MKTGSLLSRGLKHLRAGAAALAALQMCLTPLLAAGAETADNPGLGYTRTPIKHVIVIIGENRSFDHVSQPTCQSRMIRSITCSPRASSRSMPIIMRYPGRTSRRLTNWRHRIWVAPTASS